MPKRHGKNSRSSFFYSFLFLPKEKREAMITLYDFCRRTDDIIDSDRAVEERAHTLREWKQRLAHSLDGQSGDASLVKIVSVIKRFNIPPQLFFELIDGVGMDLLKSRYETFEELYPYCYGVGSTVGLMSIEIFGYRNRQAKLYAVNLGIALQLINILRDLQVDVANGRIYLPLKDLESSGYQQTDLQEYKVSEQLDRLIRLECERARNYLRTARTYLQGEDHRTLYPAEAMAAVYERLLMRIERRPSQVFQAEIRLSPFSKFSLALGAWLKYRVGLSVAT